MGGAYRFLQRVWTLTQEYMQARDQSNGQPPDDAKAIRRSVNRTIRKVTHDLRDLSFNTAIAAQMELLNELYKQKAADHFANSTDWQFAVESLLQLLAPFAPHMSDELWQQLGQTESVHLSTWPEYDEQYLSEDSMTIVVQINGKVRAQFDIATTAQEDEIVARAKTEPRVVERLAGQDIKKSIYISGKLVSFVV
jgi:leucyl-tRNA synthetase